MAKSKGRAGGKSNKKGKAKDTTPKPGRSARSRAQMKAQLEVPTTEQKRIPEIEELADEYVIDRDTRMDWTKREKASKTKLHEAMRRHGYKPGDAYRLDEEKEVVLEAEEETVRVRNIKKAKDETAEAAE